MEGEMETMTPTEIRDELASICLRLSALADERLLTLGSDIDQNFALRANERIEVARDAVQSAYIKIAVAYDLPDRDEAKSA